jgi:arsenate reductase (thioredoxin)
VITVLFACVHNAGRSQIAAALFNHYADRSKARAISAGTHPADRVHTGVVATMKDRGFDLASQTPQRLTPELAGQAQWLITMGCGDECPVVPGAKRDDWPIPDPKGQSADTVNAIVDDIDRRVRRFVDAHRWAAAALKRP